MSARYLLQRLFSGSMVALMSDGRIDVHGHFLPGAYREAAAAAGHAQPDGFHELPAWTAAGHLEVMDRLGIATTLLSISSPGVHFGDDAAGPGPGGQRGGPPPHRGASGPPRAARVRPGPRHRRVSRRDPLLLRAPGRGRDRPAHQRRRHLPRRPGAGARIPRAGPPPRPRVPAPDVAAVLGADLAGAAPPDARVPLRHDPGRGEPGAQRHRRPLPRHRVHRTTPAPPCRSSPTGWPRSPGCCPTSTARPAS